MSYTIGYDCGWQGAVTIFKEGQLVKAIDFKKIKDLNIIDSEKLYQDIKDVIGDNPISKVYIEAQYNPNDKKQKGSFTNAKNYGVLVSLSLRFTSNIEEIYPVEWQTFFRVIKQSKKKIAERAIFHKFPREWSVTPRGRQLDGRTDSYLVHLFGVRRDKARLRGEERKNSK